MATYKYDEYFTKASEKYGVNKNLLLAVAKTESNFDAKAKSSAGAKGVMQLMDATARELGVTNSYDAEQNIMGGAKYLSQLLKKYDGDTTKALASYNAGSGNVSKYGASKYSNYYNKVYANLELINKDDPFAEAEENLKENAKDIVNDAHEKTWGDDASTIDKIVNIIATVLVAIIGIVFIALSISSATGTTNKITGAIKTVAKAKKGDIKGAVKEASKTAGKELQEGVEKVSEVTNND